MRQADRQLHDRRGGLTLIELLVAMAIIAILAGLFFAGMKEWNASAARRVTLTRLALLNGLMANLDATGHNQYLNQWFFNKTSTLNAQDLCQMNPDAEGSVDSMVLDGQSTQITGSKCSRAMAIYYMVYDGTGTPPAACPSTSYGIMFKLAQLPNNAKALAQLPSDAVTSLAQEPGSVLTSSFGLAVTYVLDAKGNPIRTLLVKDANGNPIGTPVVLDGWGNPIVLVPAGGLSGVIVNGTIAHHGAGGPQQGAIVTAPDGQPFFASAGPDGDFINGADNVYSFDVH
jgi:prepilin-type N-terminal cleavage/methylation domain-containing protein